jgi:hypothetical protein
MVADTLWGVLEDHVGSAFKENGVEKNFARPEAALLGFPSSLEANFGLQMYHA